MEKKDIAMEMILISVAAMTLLTATANGNNRYVPAIHGTICAKYEYESRIGKGRFEIRNARLSVEGKVIPIVRYKAEIDLSDEGAIKMLDAYIRLQPKEALKFTFGQMRVPFTIDAHRSPHMQFFANRSFIAKQVGNGLPMPEYFSSSLAIFGGSHFTVQQSLTSISARQKMCPLT